MRLRVRRVDVGGAPTIVVNEADVAGGLVESRRARLVHEDRTVYVEVLTTRTLVGRGEVGLNEAALRLLRAREGDYVELRLPRRPRSIGYIVKRLRGQRLREDEIRAIVEDVVSGGLGEAEIAAFLASQVASPLSTEELTYLIKAMAYTSEVIEWDEPAYDEHSIGGVPGNSKVALLAVPIVASTGVLIPKTSSRAITSPAGTADTMEVLAPVDLSPQEIREAAKRARGVLAWGGSLNIAVADDIFVEIERRLMIDPHTQMVASILSKKLAMGIKALVVDIPVGRGAKVETTGEAEHIAGLFISQASPLGITLRAAITFGGEPIGRTVGPALEAREALETLMRGRGSPSLVTKAVGIAGLVLELAGRAEKGGGQQLARRILEEGKAYAKMREIIEVQGGDPNVKPDDIEVGPYTYTLTSPLEGAVTHIDNAAVTLVARALGAPQDKKAGIVFHAKIGHRVRPGDPIMTLYASSEARLDEAVRLMEKTSPVLVEGMLVKVLP